MFGVYTVIWGICKAVNSYRNYRFSSLLGEAVSSEIYFSSLHGSASSSQVQAGAVSGAGCKARAGDVGASSYLPPASAKPSGSLLSLSVPPGEVVVRSGNLELVNPFKGPGTESALPVPSSTPYTRGVLWVWICEFSLLETHGCATDFVSPTSRGTGPGPHSAGRASPQAPVILL